MGIKNFYTALCWYRLALWASTCFTHGLCKVCSRCFPNCFYISVIQRACLKHRSEPKFMPALYWPTHRFQWKIYLFYKINCSSINNHFWWGSVLCFFVAIENWFWTIKPIICHVHGIHLIFQQGFFIQEGKNWLKFGLNILFQK